MVKGPHGPAGLKPRKRVLYVEGGGDRNPSLAREVARAFKKLFTSAGIDEKPKVVVCGGRSETYRRFCIAHAANDADVWLLVDAEALAPIGPPFDPWSHVKHRPGDNWSRPPEATDEQLQLMNVCMETWLVADHDALKKIFGPKLDEAKLPPEDAALEKVEKSKLFAVLAAATKPTPAGPYNKGSKSFKVLAEVAPAKLRRLSWADRFLTELG